MSFFDFWTIWWSSLLHFIEHIDWVLCFGIFVCTAACYVFLRMSRGNGKFDFAEMFEGDNGRTSMGKFLGFIGGLTGTWLMVALETSGKMTEGYLWAYLGIMVAGKVASEYVTSTRKPDPPSDVPQRKITEG